MATSLDIQNTWSLQQILEEIDKTRREILTIDDELNDLFTERVDLEERVASLSSYNNDMSLIQNRTSSMSSSIHAASISGNEISFRVSELDNAQTSVENVLKRVTLLLDLKETISLIEESINNYKYDIASKEIYRLLHNPLTPNLDIKAIDQISYDILLDLESRLIVLIQKKCDDAIIAKKKDVENIIKYASLYRYFDQNIRNKGLDIYINAIHTELLENLKQYNLTLNTLAANSIIDHVAICGQYIDHIFNSITQNERELKQLFNGCKPLLKLVEMLHNETNIELTKLLNHYLKTNNMRDITSKIQNFYKLKHLNAGTLSSSSLDNIEYDIFKKMKQIIDINNLDKVLEEISHISQELMAYDATITTFIAESKSDDNKSDKSDGNINFNQCSIGKLRTSLISDYILMEQFNMEYQIYRILIEGKNMNDDDNDNDKTSDRIFYLLRTLAVRSFHTYDCNVAGAIINNICTILDNIYLHWLDKKLLLEPGQKDQTNYAQQLYKSSKSIFINNNNNNNLNNYAATIIILNNISQSILNIYSLKKQLSEEIDNIFTDVSTKNKLKISRCLEEFSHLKIDFETILDRGIYRYSKSFQGILKKSFDKFCSTSYEITDREYKKRQKSISDESFVSIFKLSTKVEFYKLRKRLSSSNFNLILKYILSYYFDELERYILSLHKFTFWGALKFDNDRQLLQSYINEYNIKSIRNEFQRIRSIASILQFDNINEAINYLNDDLMTTASNQTITSDEIKKFLSLRVDFDQQKIQQLQL